jgi:hypothetical protein
MKKSIEITEGTVIPDHHRHPRPPPSFPTTTVIPAQAGISMI